MTDSVVPLERHLYEQPFAGCYYGFENSQKFCCKKDVREYQDEHAYAFFFQLTWMILKMAGKEAILK